MKQKRFLSMFALLLMAATGAMAQSAFTAKEITSASQLTSTDDEAYVAACMPSDFLAVDADVAKAWTGAPTAGSATLIYAIDGNKIKIATFLNGDYKVTTGATWSIATFKDQLPNGKFFYTAPAPATYSVTLAEGTEDGDNWTISPTEAAEGATVTATYSGEKKVKSVKAVKKAAATIPVTSITLNKTATSIKVGSTETLSVTAVAPDNATDKTYTWKTSDASKATVDQDGKVTAVAAGTVTIYAEANDGSGVKGSCTVTVTPATITVTWNNNDITGSGNSFTKDGVTITMSSREIDFGRKNFRGGLTFTTNLGNFTKIEVTARSVSVQTTGTGWSRSGNKCTWTGNASSSVSFDGDINDSGSGNIKFVFTIEPKN